MSSDIFALTIEREKNLAATFIHARKVIFFKPHFLKDANSLKKDVRYFISWRSDSILQYAFELISSYMSISF